MFPATSVAEIVAVNVPEGAVTGIDQLVFAPVKVVLKVDPFIVMVILESASDVPVIVGVVASNKVEPVAETLGGFVSIVMDVLTNCETLPFPSIAFAL